MALIRRLFLGLVLSLPLLGGAACSGGGGGGGAPAEGDMAMGAPEGAKVTVVEYVSPTCHVCAGWQKDVWPEFKARYVDTHQVRYVMREMPTPPIPVAAAGFLLARCAGEDRYFDVIHEMLASVEQWDAGLPPRQTLVRIAGGLGMSEAQLQECITDEKAIEALNTRIKAAQDAGVTGTPTFFVNGVAAPDRSMSGLSQAIEAAKAKP